MTRRESGNDFQVNQDLAFQQRDWRAQRIGWVILLLLVAAALSGALGHGPLGRAEAGSAGRLQLAYERLTRHGSSSMLDVRLPPSSTPGDARLWLDRRYLESVRLESIVPEPESAEVTADRVTYTFKLGAGDQPARVTFDISPMGMWSVAGALGLEGSDSLTFTQFVYP